MDERNNIEIEALVLKKATHRWQKVAKVVAEIVGENKALLHGKIDLDVANSVWSLIEDGNLLSQGHKGEIRYCEIRLPEISVES